VLRRQLQVMIDPRIALAGALHYSPTVNCTQCRHDIGWTDGRAAREGGAHAGFTHATPAFLTRHLTPARTSAPEYRVTARVRFTPLHSGQTRQNSPIFESCLPRRRELDYRQLKTVADKNLKSEHVYSNCSIHTAISHRQDRLVVSGGRCELGTRVRYGGRCP